MYDFTDAWHKFTIWAGGFVAVVGGLSASTVFAAVGAAVAVGGLILNWWHKREMLKLERARFEMEKQIAGIK